MMENLFAEFGQTTHMPVVAIAGRLVFACLLGAAVGFEREWHRRPAGLRTHILVCLAAATVAVLAIEITHLPAFGGETVRIDPLRLIEAVTAGIAFLAAGFIVFNRGEVHGLTTGAGMWLAGGIGLATGLGFWEIATLATLLAVIVLWLMRVLERRLALKGFQSPTDEE